MHQNLAQRGLSPVDLIRRRLRQLRRDRRGGALAEFAVIAPVLFLVTFGVLEFALVAFVSVMMEAGVRDASRFGLTGATTADGSSRQDRIEQIISDRTLGLVAPDKITIDVKTYQRFSDIGLAEPFEDDNGNGLYDVGEAFTDMNGNATHDDDRGTPGPGGSEDIVLYEIAVDWSYITPVVGKLVGEAVTLRSALAVRNEPYNTTGIGGSGT